MTSLEPEFALIGTINYIVEKNPELLKWPYEPILLKTSMVMEFARYLECCTGIMTLNRFSYEDLVCFMKRHDDIFYKRYDLDDKGKPQFDFRFWKVSEGGAIHIVRNLFDRFDPPVNHPMEIMEASGLIPALRGDEN